MDLGELQIFCKDFRINLSKQVIGEIYKQVSVNKKSLELTQFKDALPHLGLAYCQKKTTEIEYRLLELKNVLEYPLNQNEIKLHSKIIELIHENPVFVQRKEAKKLAVPENIDQSLIA